MVFELFFQLCGDATQECIIYVYQTFEEKICQKKNSFTYSWALTNENIAGCYVVMEYSKIM